MNYKKEKFDLTTPEGFEKVAEFLSNDKIIKGFQLLFPVHGLLLNLGKTLMDKFFSTPDEMGKVVKDIIKEGKERGVDEMEIIMKDRGGINLGGKFFGEVKADVNFHCGKDQEIVMKVKYANG